MTKICLNCASEKSDLWYHSIKNDKTSSFLCKNCYLNLWRKKNPENVKRATKKYRDNNHNNVVNSRLKLKYGITLEDKIQMLKKQNYKCLICPKILDSVTACVDHDHITDQIRGLLCDKHNLALGLFEDSIEQLQMAINYLKRGKI
jgi:hypothetical protein